MRLQVMLRLLWLGVLERNVWKSPRSFVRDRLLMGTWLEPVSRHRCKLSKVRANTLDAFLRKATEC